MLCHDVDLSSLYMNICHIYFPWWEFTGNVGKVSKFYRLYSKRYTISVSTVSVNVCLESNSGNMIPTSGWGQLDWVCAKVIWFIGVWALILGWLKQPEVSRPITSSLFCFLFLNDFRDSKLSFLNEYVWLGSNIFWTVKQDSFPPCAFFPTFNSFAETRVRPDSGLTALIWEFVRVFAESAADLGASTSRLQQHFLGVFEAIEWHFFNPHFCTAFCNVKCLRVS